MTSKELADKHRLSVGLIKTLLRQGFPTEDFRPPDKTLEPRHVRYAEENLETFLRERRERADDVAAVAVDAPAPECVAALAAAPQHAGARAPRKGGEHRVFVHKDVLGFLDDAREERRLKANVKRLLREMLVEGRLVRRVKSTRGVNAGWLRAPLGDNGGHHYYLWHALQGKGPAKELGLARGEVAVRGVRHHDETKDKLDSGAAGDYLALDARQYMDLFEEDPTGADVLSEEQRRAFQSSALATITKGHPGAGKTTLQLERTRRLEGRLLFVTFGAAQRDEAARWLKTYAPAELDFFAWTHEELFRALDPAWTLPPPTAEAAAILAEALAGELPRLGVWRAHLAALHAELRAHYWGRALPIDLRTEACLSAAARERSYRERRAEALGEPAVDAALRAVAALPEAQTLRLFGDQQRAAGVAERLARGEPLPGALRDLGAVLVDEVQDLTLVEALVCALVAHTAARQTGARPAFHVAGDEGQTVRATDFDWGELKDLVSRLLGAPDEFQLPGNVRSPRTLTRVVNRSWDLYKAVGKSARPRGYAEAEVDESAVGHVLWVESGPDLDRVLGVIAKIPGAALVYPDVGVPPEVREAADRAGVLLTLGAPEAKGLGFRVVFVLDAGRLAHEVWTALPQVPSKAEESVIEIESRMRVDSIRVAISRSTEVLVFVERTLDEAVRRRLESLCGDERGLFEGVVTDVSLDELEARVDVDTSDRTELVTELLADYQRTWPDDPATALRIAARARQWLGDAGRAGSVGDPLRQEVYLAHGRALLRAATRGAGKPAELLPRANRELHLAHERELAQLALDARDVLTATAEDNVEKGLGRIAQRAMDPQATGAEDALAVLRRFLASAEAQADQYDARDWGRLLDALAAMQAPAERAPELATARQGLVERAARWALAAPQGATVTRLAERAIGLMADPPVGLRALLAERQERWAEAIALFRQAGQPDEGLRISRERGDDPQRSAELAREAGAEARPVVERLARVHAELAALDAEALTEAEQELLVRKVRTQFAARKRSRS